MTNRFLTLLNAIGCLALIALVVLQWGKEGLIQGESDKVRAELAAADARNHEQEQRWSALGRDIGVLKESTPFLPLSEPLFSPSCAPTLKSNFLAICQDADAPRMMLGGANPVLQGYEGYALREVIPVAALPKRIAFQSGLVSLAADPVDRRGSFLVVYLVNDTDEILPGVIGELQKAVTQVKAGGFWVSDQPFRGQCGSVPPPRDLPPRSALALGAWFAARGESRCLRRFAFDVGGRRVISEPIPGVFTVADAEENLSIDDPVILERYLRENLKPGRWPQAFMVRNIEEFAALLEMARHFGQFVTLRRELAEWITARTTRQDLTDGEAPAVAAMVKTLAKPWIRCNDQQALANHARKVLQKNGSLEYGAPEKFHATVWGFLRSVYIIRGSRDFHAESTVPDDETLAGLAHLADKVMREATDAREVDAAGWFLASGFLSERHLPLDVFRGYLGSGKPLLIRTALEVLDMRGGSDEAGQWLLAHAAELGDHAAACYWRTVWRHYGGLADWEYPVIGQLLRTDPLNAFAVAGGRISRVPADRVSETWVLSLRAFLRNEATPGRRAWWTSRGAEGAGGSFDGGTDQEVEGLAIAIRRLRSWGDRSDIGVFRAYLDHPAARYQKAGRGFGKLVFVPRAAAYDALVGHNEPVPKDLVREQLVINPERSPQSRWTDVFENGTSRVLLGGAACAGLVGLAAWAVARWKRRPASRPKRLSGP